MMIEELVAADSHSKRPKKETSGRMGFAATGIPQDGLCQPEKDGKFLGFEFLGFPGKLLAASSPVRL
jgi:hypothetical protein